MTFTLLQRSVALLSVRALIMPFLELRESKISVRFREQLGVMSQRAFHDQWIMTRRPAGPAGWKT